MKQTDNEKIYVKPRPLRAIDILWIIAGSAMYGLSVNIFMKPLDLYAGGVVGLAQLIRTLLFSNVTAIDAAGLINLCLNIPLFLLAWTSMSKKMVIGTLVSVAAQTIVMTLVKAPSLPLLDDKLACIVIAGIIGGIGCGLVLIHGGSAGGLDLLGVFMTQNFKNFSVGTMNILFNAVLYGICAYLFDVGTAIYSIIFVAVFSIVVDRWHYQNIELELMIFTHHPEVKDMIMTKYVRGVTCWEGIGAYTGNETEVLVTVVSKYEVEWVKQDILKIDPQAFIIQHTGTNVTGGYQKRLV